MPGFAQASDLNAWSALQDHHQKLGKDIVLKEYFKKDPQRFEKFSRTFKNDAENSRSCSTFPRTSSPRRH